MAIIDQDLDWAELEQLPGEHPGPNGDFSGPRIWQLGGEDPEMALSAMRVHTRDEPIVFARSRRTRDRVTHAANDTYNALPDSRLLRAGQIITVETATVGITPDSAIDHHGGRGSNADEDRSPSKATKVASIIKTVRTLGDEPTHEDNVMAVADHCAAYGLANRCLDQGVTADDTLRLKIVEIAKIQAAGMSVELWQAILNIEKQIQEMVAGKLVALAHNELDMDGTPVWDLRNHDFAPGYDVPLLVVQVAGGLLRQAVLVRWPDEQPGHPRKDFLTGFFPIEAAQHFRDHYVAEHGLEQAYVDPWRCIGMAYLPGELGRVGLL